MTGPSVDGVNGWRHFFLLPSQFSIRKHLEVEAAWRFEELYGRVLVPLMPQDLRDVYAHLLYIYCPK